MNGADPPSPPPPLYISAQTYPIINFLMLLTETKIEPYLTAVTAEQGITRFGNVKKRFL
jgi:hypothetical protein